MLPSCSAAVCSAHLALFMMPSRTTPEEGGETVFPQGRPAMSGAGWSDCAKEVRLSRGTGLNNCTAVAHHRVGTAEHGDARATGDLADLADSRQSGWLCALQGLSVKSVRGDAVLFYALHPNGTTDLTSEHGSCPTLKASQPPSRCVRRCWTSGGVALRCNQA